LFHGNPIRKADVSGLQYINWLTRSHALEAAAAKKIINTMICKKTRVPR